MQKRLKNVDLKKEKAYIKTFLGEQEITGINKTDWWVHCGRFHSYACFPDEFVRIERRK